MPQNSCHPEYAEMAPVWELITDAIAGRRAIIAGGEKYLPKLLEQDPNEYGSYQGRGVWFNATGKTAAGWVGIVTRKKPAIYAPTPFLPWLDNCDQNATAFSSYVQTVIRHLCEKSRCGTLIDWTTDTVPYLAHYKAEQIINWDMKTVNGVRMLSFLMLYEQSTKWEPITGDPMPDEYDWTMFDQWREFRLVIENGVTAVVSKVWRLKKKGQDSQQKEPSAVNAGETAENFIEVSSTVLQIRGNNVDFIPFFFHTASNTPPECVAKPMLEDIAELNVAHWKASADIWNGRHMAGLPTPWAVKFTDPDKPEEKISLGTGAVWVSEDKDAKCGMLEMEGKALKSIQEGMAELEANMAAMGAQAIEPQKDAAEAVGTVELRHRAETASLVTLVEMASRTLSLVLQTAFWVQDTTGKAKPQDFASDVYVVIPSQLTSGKMSSAELQQLTASYINGAISFETFFHNMQEGEMYSEDRTIDEEREAITEGGPTQPLPPVDPDLDPGTSNLS